VIDTTVVKAVLLPMLSVIVLSLVPNTSAMSRLMAATRVGLLTRFPQSTSTVSDFLAVAAA
jgi:hypothetical protein